MFPFLVRVALSKKPAAASSIWSLHRAILLLPPSLKPSSNQYHYYHHKVSVSSTETIKPSSPTPAKLATFKLSLIDNHVPPIYVPFIFFFPAPRNRGSNSIAGEKKFETLKSSLAQALTRFYPLAGRLSKIGDINGAGSVPVVHCNDEGLPFSSATVDLSMAQFLRKRIEIDSLEQFLPFPADLIVSGLESVPQIGFRATEFPCGGLAIGVCFFHKIVDGPTLADFLKLWSAVARSEEKTAAAVVGDSAYAHDLAATSLLPLRHDDVAAAPGDFVGEQGKIVTRRLAFDEEAIHALKAIAKSDQIPNPSRSEAVGGFLWKHVMSAAARAASTDGSNPRSVVSIAMSVHHNDHQHDSLNDGTKTTVQELVRKLRSSVAKLDKEFMTKLQGRDGRREYLMNLEALWKPAIDAAVENETIVVPFRITSNIGMRFYDVDFGWGKPAWVTMARFPNPIPNLAVLLQSPVESGVEVWLTLHEKEMAILEQEPEFATYAKNNMPVL
ncbi:unnamed protein product [Linum tenue]|uniref:Uncharacterized protein n=1 Tax=Linum tenue TaxID=586396 RepID=A0AAV0NBP2_9ROSI|nr:unnamed protein product [Linum tenue]